MTLSDKLCTVSALFLLIASSCRTGSAVIDWLTYWLIDWLTDWPGRTKDEQDRCSGLWRQRSALCCSGWRSQCRAGCLPVCTAPSGREKKHTTWKHHPLSHYPHFTLLKTGFDCPYPGVKNAKWLTSGQTKHICTHSESQLVIHLRPIYYYKLWIFLANSKPLLLREIWKMTQNISELFSQYVCHSA